MGRPGFGVWKAWGVNAWEDFRQYFGLGSVRRIQRDGPSWGPVRPLYRVTASLCLCVSASAATNRPGGRQPPRWLNPPVETANRQRAEQAATWSTHRGWSARRGCCQPPAGNRAGRSKRRRRTRRLGADRRGVLSHLDRLRCLSHLARRHGRRRGRRGRCGGCTRAPPATAGEVADTAPGIRERCCSDPDARPPISGRFCPAGSVLCSIAPTTGMLFSAIPLANRPLAAPRALVLTGSPPASPSAA